MSTQVLKRPIQQVRLDKSVQDNAYFDSVNQSINSIIPVGPYANDAAAAAAGVPKFGTYYDTNGIQHVRLV